MFQGWEAFYTLTGTCSGALISLLFVVATLTSGHERPANSRGLSIYMSPIVFHFAVVIAISATALAPRLPAPLADLAIAACAGVGVVHMLVNGRLFAHRDFTAPHWSDFWCYVAVPGAIYLALGVVAAALRFVPDVAVYALGLALLTLMLSAIRNAWDLVTWMAPRAPRNGGSDAGSDAPGYTSDDTSG